MMLAAVLIAARILLVSADASATSPVSSTDQNDCMGLPRNTLLTSCPAPCLPDSPCIVYDQDAEHSKLTGCDYNTAGPSTFCWSKPAQTCEFQCLGRHFPAWALRFTVQPSTVMDPKKLIPRAPPDPKLLETSVTGFQSPDFVFGVGKLVLSENITEVSLTNWATSNITIDVDPAVLSLAPGVTSFSLSSFHVGNDRIAAIVANMPPAMKKLELLNMNVTAMSWTTLASLPNLETLKLTYSPISRIWGTNRTLPALTTLTVTTCSLTGFDLQAPKLSQLDLQDNKLVRIPESVFTYSQLKYLYLSKNPIYRPLVLTAQQLKFLEGLSTVSLKLVDPPDQDIVTRLPSIQETNYNYGNYTDDMNISSLLDGATQTLLRNDRLLPVLVVDSEKAATYNNVLELRARYRTGPRANTSTREVSCLDLPRNTLLASCPAPCLADSPCIVYDQDVQHTKLTGCDYNSASQNAFCWSKPAQTLPGSWHVLPRTTQDVSLADSKSDAHQSLNFVTSVGKLNLSEAITTVDITAYPGVDRTVNLTVTPTFLDSSPWVTTLNLRNIPLGDNQVTAIVASRPKLKALDLQNTNLVTPPWVSFASAQSLTSLHMNNNQITIIAGGNASMAALAELELIRNNITGFDLQAPELTRLNLQINKLVRIPESVFTYSQLSYLNLRLNPLFRPLVLTAQQVQFLESLPQLFIDRLVDPPDQGIVSRLPTTGENKYGNYSDTVDISLLLEGSTQTLLRKDPLLPVRVVDSEKAAAYNKVLEMRARFNEILSDDPYGLRDRRHVPESACEGVQRNALLSNCAVNTCPTNGACVVYDQLADLSLPSGCDYDVASIQSACLSAKTGNCEVQCFATYEPQSEFKFFIPFQAELGPKTPRHLVDDDVEDMKTTDIPFLSNSFLSHIGQLSLTSTVTEVLIAGGRMEKGTRGLFADVIVSSSLLRKSPSVTSLALLNIDLSRNNLPDILASSPPALKSLNLRNTNLAALPEETFVNVKQLVTLSAEQNSITDFVLKPSTLPNLETLDLSENALATINIDSPNLKTLILRANNLVNIPPSIFALRELDTLDLDGNPFKLPLALTRAQVDFLQSVPNVMFSIRQVRSGSAESVEIPVSSGVPRTSSTASSSGTTAIPLESGGMVDIAYLLANGGVLAVVRGIEVIIVGEELANQYNSQLEQSQSRLMPTLQTRTGETLTPPSTSSATPPISGSHEETNETTASPGLASDTTDSPSFTRGIIPSSQRSKNSSSTPASKDDAVVTPTTTGLSMKLVLAGFVSVFFVAVVILSIVLTRRKVTAASKESTYQAITNTADESTTSTTQQRHEVVSQWWKDDVLLSHRLDAGRISDERVIGSNDSGVTWLVNYKVGSRKLVSKRVIQGEGPAYDAKVLQLVAEAKIASTLRYATIVRFVGVAWTSNTDLQVLYEYMSQGDLGSYLSRTNPSTLPWLHEKLQLAINIIEALVFTHSFNPPLVHRNLKASNILLGDKGEAKLSEFGCLRVESETNTMTTDGVGSGRWLAPEILSGSSSYGTPSDIYSFGVVLCELDTHQVPYAEVGEQMPESTLLERVGRGELRPTLSATCPSEIRELAESCLAYNPEDRPTSLQVAHKLRLIRAQETSE